MTDYEPRIPLPLGLSPKNNPWLRSNHDEGEQVTAEMLALLDASTRIITPLAILGLFIGAWMTMRN